MYLNKPTLKYSDFFKLIFKSSHIFMHSLLSGYKCVVFLSCYHIRRSCMSHYTLKRLRVSLYKNGNPIKAICIKLIVCLFTWMWSEKKLSLLPYFPSWRHKKNAIKPKSDGKFNFAIQFKSLLAGCGNSRDIKLFFDRKFGGNQFSRSILKSMKVF